MRKERFYYTRYVEAKVDGEVTTVPYGHHLVDGYSVPVDNGHDVIIMRAEATDAQHAALIALDGVSEHVT